MALLIDFTMHIYEADTGTYDPISLDFRRSQRHLESIGNLARKQKNNERKKANTDQWICLYPQVYLQLSQAPYNDVSKILLG